MDRCVRASGGGETGDQQSPRPPHLHVAMGAGGSWGGAGGVSSTSAPPTGQGAAPTTRLACPQQVAGSCAAAGEGWVCNPAHAPFHLAAFMLQMGGAGNV